MSYANPPISWSEFERKLSDRQGRQLARQAAADAPISHRRPALDPAAIERPDPETVVPYAELHCHSNFSFLDGVSDPEALVREAVRLGLKALALTDHDGFYGVVRMAEAAERHQLATVFGAELSLDLPSSGQGVADPQGTHLLVLCRGEEGYHRLAAAMTDAHLLGDEKGKPIYELDSLAERLEDRVFILTGCRKGAVRQALRSAGAVGARQSLVELVTRFGADQVVVELTDLGFPTDNEDNDVLAALAGELGLAVVASGVVHAATPAQHRLAAATAAVRARRSVAEMDGWLPPRTPHLRSGAEMAELFAAYPGAVAHSVQIAAGCAFPLQRVRPRLPRQNIPPEHTPMSWLRELVRRGADELYAGTGESVAMRLERELNVIEAKDFSGYFLIVHDLVRFARERGILCQGRGSAANSAVCYALGITAVDSIRYDLPFERFLSTTRDEEPDIDVDFDSDRREEVIQYVYATYGRRNAAQVANVISYRPRSAVRDMAKALGYSTGLQDAWSTQIHESPEATPPAERDIPESVVELTNQLLRAPRHLGIHSGGMVLTDRPVGEVCPIEPARMANRTVLQWDKDDCAWMGLVKFDLLGLGMLGAIQHTFDLISDKLGENWTLVGIPKEEAGVYDMLCRADSVGVFQVESRAQMGTLPRLQPRRFYDLVCEIALIRPGPVQGNAVHPFIRRRTGREPVSYLHPALEPVLKRTLGVPLFQEQLMQMAIAVGKIDGDEADLLRRAMGSKRGIERISSLKDKLYAGMRENGIEGEIADEIYCKIEAFAHFGFAESHSISFALLVYASAWLRLHYPGAFLAALLRSQPMGFYSPLTLVEDAKRHGVQVWRPDINLSTTYPTLERQGAKHGATGTPSCLESEQPPVPRFDPENDGFDSATHRRDGAFAVRMGLSSVKGVGVEVADRIVAERNTGGHYRSMADLARRAPLSSRELEVLAGADAFASFKLSRRQALWWAGPPSAGSSQTLPGTTAYAAPPELPGLSELEITQADLRASGTTPGEHPLAHLRNELHAHGVLRIEDLHTVQSGSRVQVGGLVTHRQRPATASGITFINLEDETGMANVVCSRGFWARYRRIARDSNALIIRGIVQNLESVISIKADGARPLTIGRYVRSRDFR